MARFPVSFGLITLWATLAHAQQFTISTIAGGLPLPPGPTPATNVAIGAPMAVAADPAGNLYFIALSSVFKLDQNGVLTHVAGVGTQGVSAGDGGPAATAQLDYPTALAADRNGNLYIAEGGGRVRKVTPDGIIATIAGNGVCHGGCWTDGAGDGGPATAAQLFYPYQLAADAVGNVYLGEWNTSRIRKISPGGIITTVVGDGDYGYSGDGGPATSAKIGAPWGLAFDSAGNLYFSDDIPGDDVFPVVTHIRKVSPGGIISTVAGTGDVGYSGDGGPATSAQFDQPGPLALDNAGNLFIADGARIRRISSDGIVTTIAGNGQGGYSGDGGAAASAAISWSDYGQGLSLATDPSGNLYVADNSNARVRKISPAGLITTVAGNGGACCDSGDGGPATAAQLNHPAGIATDMAGNVYVSDTFNDRLRKISPAGVITTIGGATGMRGVPGDGGPASAGDLAWPAGLATDNSGNLFIADSADHSIRKISAAGIITTVAGNGSPGYSGDSGPGASAQLSWPKDVTLDGAGNLYIADTGNNVVRKVSPAGIITTVAGSGILGYSGDGGPAISAFLYGPTGIALDSVGSLYVADNNNFRVRKISAGGVISTVAGNGIQGYSGDGGPAAKAQLEFPVGVKIDSTGNLYIADGSSIRRVSPAGIIMTVAGNGVLGYSGDGGLATSAQVDSWGLAFDTSGNLYVAGPWNNAVRLLRIETQQNQ